MARPTWRSVTTGNPSSAAAFGRNAIGAFTAAQSAFSEYGDFLGERAQERATATALQQALQTGEMPSQIDPRADMGAVQDILIGQETIESENLAQALTEVETELTEFELENAPEQFRLEKELTEAQIADENAARNVRNVQLTREQLGLATDRELREEAEATRKANEALYRWEDTIREQETNRLLAANQNLPAGQKLDMEAINRAANESVETIKSNALANNTMHQLIGVDRSIFERTGLAQQANRVREEAALLRAGAATAETATPEQKALAKNYEAAEQGDPSVWTVDNRGRVVVKTGKTSNYAKDDLKLAIGGALQREGTEPMEFEDTGKLNRAVDALHVFDKTMTEKIMSTAKKYSEGNPDLYLNHILYTAQQLAEELTNPETRERLLSKAVANKDRGLSNLELLQLSTGANAQEAPAPDEGFFDIIERELEGNSRAWRQQIADIALSSGYRTGSDDPIFSQQERNPRE